ncbi:M20 metallopeptidase family protein [Virgibacillus salexigens]|uniref:N-acyl-L-amino acid amidohydrolase n=2 Tax=Virgibacillus TaxID=84406 RepID=A0A024QFG7_9BACI|nr:MULTISPECIES: amidohydrolase [Virgibacillus]GGJ69629.1 putative amidohydrolase YhaA [Virgibacillus kapii]CDQ40706.1 N-acyl-L-amino acid amidohydrolase [Virgibacillus massiliensis]
MLDQIHQSIDKLYSEMVEIRRYLHQYPEISFHETKTAAFIAGHYKKLGIPYETKVGGNGVIATLKGGKPGKTIALRADFDALPIQDEKDVPYRSKIDGVMHACGHDGHTATLLSLAKVMKDYQYELPGTIVFLHQHAEEYAPGGAKPIIESGAIDHVDAVFGTHLWATTPLGVLQTSKQAFMAGADRFELTIQGKGGHGAYPHETKDAIVIGSQLISQLQQIVSRRVDPLDTVVVTVGIFEAGEAFNVIADKARLVGTVRYINPTLQDKIISEMEAMIKGVCTSNDATYSFDYIKGYPPLINHASEAELLLEIARNIEDIKETQEVNPSMAGEDFAYYLLEKPGAFFFTGAQKHENPYPHHHPKFDIDERSMPIAAKTLIEAYYAYQEK